MPEICDGVSFDTVAREWRCKWSADNDKASPAAAQKALSEALPELKALAGFKGDASCRISCCDCAACVTPGGYPSRLPLTTTPSVAGVQRVVCGGCLDFKVITSLNAEQFGDWEGKAFAPEAAFLEKLKGIPGITNVETQTFTLMPQ